MTIRKKNTPFIVLFVFYFFALSAAGQNNNSINAVSMEGKQSPSSIFLGTIDGIWTATINDNDIRIELRNTENNNGYTTNFLISKKELGSFEVQGKADLKITREAGMLSLVGNFDIHAGSGNFTFVCNQEFTKFFLQNGFTNVNSYEILELFVANVSKGFLDTELKDTIPGLSRKDAYAALVNGVDKNYQNFWKKMGYDSLPFIELFSLKLSGVDSNFLADLRTAGISNVNYIYLLGLKTYRVDSKEINNVKKLLAENNVNIDYDKKILNLSAQDIYFLKRFAIDDSYLKSLKHLGIPNLTLQEVIEIKRRQIDITKIKMFVSLGYNKVESIVKFTSSGVPPEYVEGLNHCGYRSIEPELILALYCYHITPEYISATRQKVLNPEDLLSFIQLKRSAQN